LSQSLGACTLIEHIFAVHPKNIIIYIIFLIKTHVYLYLGRCIDVAYAQSQVESVIDKLKLFRNSVDTYHEEWFAQALLLAERLGVQACIPRRAARQVNRNNMPAETESDYYKLVITIPMLGNCFTACCYHSQDILN
jgi:hypothetical protein